jgi:hypothetical protein
MPKRKYFTSEQIILKLREAEVLLSQGKSEQLCYNSIQWKKIPHVLYHSPKLVQLVPYLSHTPPLQRYKFSF